MLTFHHVVKLISTLVRYFSRRVLHVGPLRSLGARVILALALCSFILGATAIAVQFMRPVGSNMQVWRYIYDVSSISIAIFLGLRLLIDGSQDLFDFTYQLPVSHKERHSAILGFESICVVAVILVLLSAMIGATIIILGVPGIMLTATSAVTAILFYFTCVIAHNLGNALLALLGFKRLRSALLMLTTLTFLLFINSQTIAFIGSVSPPDVEERALIGFNLMPWILSKYGTISFLISAIILILGLGALALFTSPRTHPLMQRFVNIPQYAGIRGAWKVHVAYSIRNQQLWLAASLTISIFIFLGSSDSAHPLWSCLALCFPAMFHYGNTRCLRLLYPEGGAFRIWLLMTSAQFVVIGGFLVLGVGVLALWHPESTMASLDPIIGVLGSIMCSILVGTAFPAEKDNSISALFGCMVLSVCLAFFGIITGLLRLPIDARLILLALSSLTAVLSIWFIKSNERRNRYEISENTAG